MNKNKFVIDSIVTLSSSIIFLSSTYQMVYAIKPNPIKLPTNFPNVKVKSSSSVKNQPLQFQRNSLGRIPIKDPSPSNKIGLQRNVFARSPVRYPDSSRDPKKVPRITRNRYNKSGFKKGNVE